VAKASWVRASNKALTRLTVALSDHVIDYTERSAELDQLDRSVCAVQHRPAWQLN